MKKDKVRIAVGILVVVAVVIGLKWSQFHKNENKNALKIAAVLPLTGAQAHDGQEIENALRLAVESMNMNYEDARIELFVQDGKYTAKDSINAFNMLMNNNPDVVIVGGSVVAMALAPLVQQQSKVMIALMAADDELPLVNEWTFRMFPSDKEEVYLMVDFLTRKLNAHKVGLLTVDNMQGATAAKWFDVALKEKNGFISDVETFPVDGVDMRPQISKLLLTDPDTIYIFGYGVGFSAAVNQISEMGYDKEILTLDVMALDMYQRAVKDDMAKVYYTAPIFDATDKDTQKVVDAYVSKYNELPSFFAGYAYETIQLLSLIQRQGAQSATDYRDALMSIQNYRSIVGDLSFSGQRGVKSTLAVYCYADKKNKRIE